MNFYKIVVLLGFFLPFLFNYTGSFRVSQVVYTIFIFSIIFFRVITQRLRFRNHQLIAIPFIFFFIFLIFGTILGGEFLRSLSDSSRFLFFTLFVGFGIIAKNKLSQSFLEKVLQYALLFSFILTLLSYFHYFYPIVNIFKGRLSNDPIFFHFIRASGIFAFPSDLGAFCSFTFIFFLLKLNSTKNRNQYYYIIISLILIILSASRSGILQIITSFIFVCYKMNKIFFFKGIMVVCLLVLVAQIILKFDLPIINYVMIDFSNIDESILHRFKEIEYSIEILTERFYITGDERSKPFGMPVIEGFLTNLILKFSYVGLLFWVSLSILAIRLFQKSSNELSISTAIWFLTFIFFLGFFSDVLFRFKGNFIWPFLLGYTLKFKQSTSKS